MPIEIDYEVTKKPYNTTMMIAGLIFFTFRVFIMNAWKIDPTDNYSDFDSIVFHTSYFISICICLAMIFSFRVKFLNAIPVFSLLSVIITIPLKDIPFLLNPNTSIMLWLNYATLHIPVLFMGIYMLLGRKVYLSKMAYWIAFIITQSWFWVIDDKQNGVLNGWSYVGVALVMFLFWTFVCFKWIFVDIPNDTDPMIAPVIKFKRIVIKKRIPIKKIELTNRNEKEIYDDRGQRVIENQ